MNSNNEKEIEQLTKKLDTLSISSDSDISLYSRMTNYKEISTKNNFVIGHIIDSLKLNNANLALDNKMLRESVENYKKLYYDVLNKDMKDD